MLLHWRRHSRRRDAPSTTMAAAAAAAHVTPRSKQVGGRLCSVIL
jgi:hypothetical protein